MPCLRFFFFLPRHSFEPRLPFFFAGHAATYIRRSLRRLPCLTPCRLILMALRRRAALRLARHALLMLPRHFATLMLLLTPCRYAAVADADAR